MKTEENKGILAGLSACSFMAVKLSVVMDWIVPIILICIVSGALTYILCLYFGQRFGGSNDFERTLGLYGVATGTVPTGIALVRIVDPYLETTTAAELGGMNIPMMLSMVTMTYILAIAGGSVGIMPGIILLLVPVIPLLAVLRTMRLWGKKTYTLNGK